MPRVQRLDGLQKVELGGGRVLPLGPATRLALPAGLGDYADAQLDDYRHRGRRRDYPWRPGTRLTIEARFSHPPAELVGTAGFGFWNAPFGDPSVRYPALPQATWFFFASPPSDLPLRREGEGRGWFAATIDATTPKAIALAPLAPVAVLLHQLPALRQRLWPRIRERLAISFAPVPATMTDWHQYVVDWQTEGCRFLVDGMIVLTTPHSPTGPLGFVCWMDNQYLVATPRGRFASGVLAPAHNQWLDVASLTIQGG